LSCLTGEDVAGVDLHLLRVVVAAAVASLRVYNVVVVVVDDVVLS
jgi:hypothetical protein